LIRSPTFHRHQGGFCGFDQGDGLGAPPNFVNAIGTLLPIALYGLFSLSDLRQASNFMPADGPVSLSVPRKSLYDAPPMKV
jgi:hypothetical protein